LADIQVRVRQEIAKTEGTMDLLAVKFLQVAQAAGEEMPAYLKTSHNQPKKRGG